MKRPDLRMAALMLAVSCDSKPPADTNVPCPDYWWVDGSWSVVYNSWTDIDFESVEIDGSLVFVRYRTEDGAEIEATLRIR